MSSVYKTFRLRKPTEGDLGIEIEVEGNNLPMCAKYWNNERDGSLKGDETREYVLKVPSTLEGVHIALSYLESRYVYNNTTVDESIRAGVHVHVNCQKLSMTQLYTFMCVYLALENVLVKWCGQSREGNLFCLRSSDAEMCLSQIRLAAITKEFRAVLFSDDLRYASMNVKALGDYGSLEFRSMRGTRDLGLVYRWAKVLLGLREFSKTFNDPSEVINQFSILGPTGFMQEALGDEYDEFRCEDQEALLWEGVRNAQDIAFCVNWVDFEPPTKTIGQLEFPVNVDPDEPQEDF